MGNMGIMWCDADVAICFLPSPVPHSSPRPALAVPVKLCVSIDAPQIFIPDYYSLSSNSLCLFVNVLVLLRSFKEKFQRILGLSNSLISLTSNSDIFFWIRIVLFRCSEFDNRKSEILDDIFKAVERNIPGI